MDDAARRAGETEIVYRAVNEKIEDLNEAFGTLTDTMTIVCECAEPACAEQIVLGVPTYERVRSDPTLFVLLPAHEMPEVEHVVERHSRYIVVRKDPGEPQRLAVEHDPRA